MHKLEYLEGLAPDKYGSREAKVVDIKSLNTHLVYELIRLKRFPAISDFADLIYKYDLFLHSILSLSLQRLNLPKYPILFKFTTLQNMIHSYRTAFGDSTYIYGGLKWIVPVNPRTQGLGQSNESAGVIQLVCR